MFSIISAPSTSSVFSAYTTFAASSMLVRTVLSDVQNFCSQIIPRGLQEPILSKLGGLFGNLSSQMTLVIDEYNGLARNEIYESAEAYLRTRITPSVVRLKASKAPEVPGIMLSIEKGEKIVDVFEGIQLTWEMICIETQKTSFDYESAFSTENVQRKSYELSFNRKHKEFVLGSYLPCVMERGNNLKEQNQSVRIYSLGGFYGDTKLDHPATFDTLALDPTLKKEVIDDLDRFVKRRDYYRRVGKAWKRGYLLYGPPGTGKSSMIAAMANHLKFNVYDLELTSLQHNATLRQLLVSTTNRSILVIEDIDCSAKNREDEDCNNNNQKLTLSALLNFIDGLWSSCGDERIIVFTTNHKDRLDPALLRPGRMDMHIHMSYCTPSGFKILASNYLGLKDHRLFSEIEKLIMEVEATPAEIAGELMKSEEADVCLGELIKFLEGKKTTSSESNAEAGKVEDAVFSGPENEEEIKKETEKKRVKNNKRNRRKGKKQRI